MRPLPIARWMFDEPSGSTVYDISGNGIDGTITGATRTSGYMSFDGGDYISIGTGEVIGSSLQRCTIMMWVRWTAAGPDWVSAFGCYDGSQQMQIDINRKGDTNTYSAGDISAYFRDNSGNAFGFGTVGKSYNDGIWHHVCVVANNTGTNDGDLYIDGLLVPTSSSIGTGPTNYGTFTDPIGIGCRGNNGSFDKMFTGDLDDIMIFDHGLDEYEIQELLNMRMEVLDSGVTKWTDRKPKYRAGEWHFEEGTGTTSVDEVSGDTGSLSGDVTWSTGKGGNCLQFGSAGTNMFETTKDFPIKDGFTVACWIYCTGNGQYQKIGRYANGTDNTWTFSAFNSNSNPFDLTMDVYYGGNSRQHRTSNANIYKNQWNHVAAVVRSYTDVTIYVNGVAQSLTTTTTGNRTAYPFMVGNTYTPSSTHQFAGKIDEYYIFYRALSLQEIIELMDGTDVHLQSDSTLINAGDPTYDYSNEPNPNGGQINIGAYGNTWEAQIAGGPSLLTPPTPGLTWIPSNPTKDDSVDFTPSITDSDDTVLYVDYTIDGAPKASGVSKTHTFDHQFEYSSSGHVIEQFLTYDIGLGNQQSSQQFNLTMSTTDPEPRIYIQALNDERTNFNFSSRSTADISIDYYWWDLWSIDASGNVVSQLVAQSGAALTEFEYLFMQDGDYRVGLRVEDNAAVQNECEVDFNVTEVVEGTRPPSGTIEIEPGVWQLISVPVASGYWDNVTHAIVPSGAVAKIKNYVIDQIDDLYGSVEDKIEVCSAYIGDDDYFKSYYPGITPEGDAGNFPLTYTDGDHNEVLGFWVSSTASSGIIISWGG